MQKDARIYVAGHRGLVGSSLFNQLARSGYSRLITRTHDELELTNQAAVEKFFQDERPDYVFLAAARVGGIHANSTYPAEFIYSNLAVQCNVIDAAYRYGVKKLLFLGSSCIYPKLAPQPMSEECLLTSPLEPTNEWYAIAKIAGLKMCDAYRRQYGFDAIALMPTNLYGPNDNFHPQQSHVLPGLIHRFHQAKVTNAASLTIWGTGVPRREFLHSADLASAALFLMDEYSDSKPINVGCGSDVSILELAHLIAEVVDYRGNVLTDPSKPDGAPRKLLDVSRLSALGWQPAIGLREGIRSTYAWYVEHFNELRV